MGKYSEDNLVAEATQILGGDEQVLAAGVFGRSELLPATMAGTAAGGIAGSFVNEGVGNVAGAVLGGIAAKHAYAESKGETLQLLVAVTPDHIHVLNRESGGRGDGDVASFDRATCRIEVKKFGLSRTIDIEDPASGESISLTGAAMGISPLAKGDKLVLQLLDD